MNEVVITGASGFIGSHLSSYLEIKGHNVLRVSRSPGNNIVQVGGYESTPPGACLIYLAEESDVTKASKMPLSKELGGGFFERLVRSYDKVIYASSGAVYGDKASTPRSEDSETFASNNYTKTKLCREEIVLANGGMVLRLGNVFGMGMSQNTVIPEIIGQLSRHGPVYVRDEMPVRDFIHVGDVCRAFSLALRNYRPSVLNIGSGRGTQIADVARIILRLCSQDGRSVKSICKDSLKSVNILDVSLAAKEIGWQPAADLEHQLASYMKRINIH